jgi:hypothetical protein
MDNISISKISTTRKSILVLSVSQYLTSVPISEGIRADWGNEKARNITDLFDNVGFDLDPKDVPSTLKALKHELEGRSWDGIILGWCIRGHVEFTLMFEEIVAMCCEVIKSAPQTKLLFSTGPNNLVATVSRNFL